MNAIKGFYLPFDFCRMKKMADLIYESGPVLALYVSDGGYYLFSWTDCDDISNRWMIFRVTLEQLRCYVDGKITFLDVILNNPDGFVRFADYNTSGQGEFPSRTLSMSVDDIPVDYLPEDDSFFTFGVSDELRDILLSKHYYVSVPKKEQNLFFSLMTKLGWKSSAAVF